MPTAAEIKKLADELNRKKLIDLDASIRKLIEVEGLKNLDKDGEIRPFWNAVVGSGYILITKD
jgi:hypothetical protein